MDAVQPDSGVKVARRITGMAPTICAEFHGPSPSTHLARELVNYVARGSPRFSFTIENTCIVFTKSGHTRRPLCWQTECVGKWQR